MNGKERRAAKKAAKTAQAEVPVQEVAVETTEASTEPTTMDDGTQNPKGGQAPDSAEPTKETLEREAEDALLGKPGVETPSATETGRAKANRRHAVGSAVDGTVFAIGGDRGEPKARPNTLAGALYDELKVNGAGTCSELVERLNRDGVYERVALKSATLRPYSSVMYWLKTWRGEGLVSVVIPGAEAPATEPTSDEPAAVEQVA